jgi:hypothetical protein
MSILDLIHGAEKYATIAKFLVRNRAEVTDLASTGGKAVEAIEKSDPAIIPHLEELAVDLVKKAGPPPPSEEHPDPHVAAKHVIAQAIVRPDTLSADERAWMERASASG